MIKTAIPLLLFAIYSTASLAQNIDSLNSDNDVISFIRKLKLGNNDISIDAPKPVYAINNYKLLLKKFGSASFEKIDLDGNGQTDLLINGYADYDSGNKWCRMISLVILAFPNDSFQVKELTHGPFIDFFAARIIRIKGMSYISSLSIHYKYDYHRKKTYQYKKTDTLTYIFDEFIEKSKPATNNIEKIQFCVFGGLGNFPAMRITLSDTLAMLESDPSRMLHTLTTMDSGGVFEVRLNPNLYSRICELLRYINFLHLKKTYSVGWTDDLEGSLKITFDHGKVKKIDDYGLAGTRGLAAVQQLLIKLRNTQHWEKIKNADPDMNIPVFFCEY